MWNNVGDLGGVHADLFTAAIPICEFFFPRGGWTRDMSDSACNVQDHPLPWFRFLDPF